MFDENRFLAGRRAATKLRVLSQLPQYGCQNKGIDKFQIQRGRHHKKAYRCGQGFLKYFLLRTFVLLLSSIL